MSQEFIPPEIPPVILRKLADGLRGIQPLADQIRPLTESAARISESLRPQMDAVRVALDQMAGSNSIGGVMARQREAMAAIQSRFTDWPVPAPAELEEARASLQRNLPETPEQVEEIGQRAATIEADSEQRSLIERMTGALKQADL